MVKTTTTSNTSTTTTHLSGMALSIRSSEESTTFDLGGQSVATIQHTIEAAFSQPFPNNNNKNTDNNNNDNSMIRLTFVTGAGKQARQKYDDGAARAVTSTLKSLGYHEDRAASCVMECAGSFKLQHDTGKNLKTVVVFPKMTTTSAQSDSIVDNQQQQPAALVPQGCPAHKIAMSSPTTFERMLHTQCPTWSQKKGCAASLEHLQSMVRELDDKLMHGQPLDAAEQDFYNHVTGLDEKLTMVKKALHHHVDTGDITVYEQQVLLEQNAERMASLEKELLASTAPQQQAQYQSALDKVTQRRTYLQQLTPKDPRPLKHHVALARLWKQVHPLIQLEEGAKGRLLTVSETQSLARKEELLEEIEELENASRGWFEDEIAFEARLDEIRTQFTTNKASSKGGSKKGGNGSSGGNSLMSSTNAMKQQKWVTPGERQAWKKGGRVKKKKTGHQAGGVFTAMMADDDSSDDEDEITEEEDEPSTTPQQQEDTQNSSTPMTTSTTNETTTKSPSSKMKKGSKKKKKNKSRSAIHNKSLSEDAALDAAAAANNLAQSERNAKPMAHPAMDFLQNYLLPFLLSLLTLIATLILGKPKDKKKKKE